MASRPLGRLRKGREFDTAYSKGTVTNGPLFVVRVFPNGLDHNRWGFAVGKKLVPSAVDRNRVRRRLREAIRALEPARPGAAGFDGIVTAKARASHANWDQLVSELGRQVDGARQRR